MYILVYSFKEPTITPLTKYFCTNGYTAIIGAVIIIKNVILKDSVVTELFP